MTVSRDPAEWSEEAIFAAASALPPEEREAYLDAVCRDLPERKTAVRLLLASLGDEAFLRPKSATEAGHGESSGSSLPRQEQAGEEIGNYKLLQQIGEGGFGTVWMAEQERPVRRRVALKIIKPGMDSREVVARFEQERQALALMDHPNIARVFDAGATPLGRPFFVMELVRGVKITEYCDQAMLSTADRLRLFIAVCHALQHAHQKGIIHRDLKPSNILVTLHDGVPVPKVIDFGVAKATQQQRLTDLTLFTRFEQMIGTPLYMSPEQAELSGLDVDTRSDIYSLGVLLYELLAGRTPFDPETLMKSGLDEMRRVIREEQAPRPSTYLSTMAAESQTALAKHRHTDRTSLIGQIRGDLDWIVMKSLEKDRNRRYETANEFAQDIQRHLVSEPVQARPPSVGYRFRRLVIRNKGSFTAAAGIAAALVVGISVSTWQAFRANAALSELRASAPAFEAMARGLVAKEEFDQAFEKLDVAIKLQPNNANYLLTKADLLESQLRFSEAGLLYREALRLAPAKSRAGINADLCEKLARKTAIVGVQIPRESLVELYGIMTEERRSAAEMMRVGKLLGEENNLLRSYWLDRLKELPVSPQNPLENRLTVNRQGALELDLSNTEISDLSPLEGMPLAGLDLTRCDKVVDLSSLCDIPLKTLRLSGTEMVDLRPLTSMKTLRILSLSATKVHDISPLRGLSLESLDLGRSMVGDLNPLKGMTLQTLNLSATPVTALAPLAGMPLKVLNLAGTQVADVSPLAGMPLRELDCTAIPASDFSPLAGAPLQYLNLEDSRVRDLAFLSGMPLKTLYLFSTEHSRGFEALGELKSLEQLTLRWWDDLSEAEIATLSGLRDLPGLRLLKVGLHGDFPTQEAFWDEFDEITRCIRVVENAESMARQGKYSEAARLFGDMLAGRYSADDGHFAYKWTQYGTLKLASGDIPAFQSICKEMVGRFRRRGDGDEPAVRLSVLSADSGIPIAELKRLMPHVALINPNSFFHCWFLLTNGLLEYREGRNAEAIKSLGEVETDAFPAALASAAAALAMAHFDQGNFTIAQAQLDNARSLAGTNWPNVPDREQWNNWLYAQILIREAEKLMASRGKASSGK